MKTYTYSILLFAILLTLNFNGYTQQQVATSNNIKQNNLTKDQLEIKLPEIPISKFGPEIPPKPNIISSQNGVVTLSKGRPPFGVEWYWQTSSNGISTASSASTYTVRRECTVYLRAKLIDLDVWSDASFVIVSFKPHNFYLGISAPYLKLNGSETGVSYQLLCNGDPIYDSKPGTGNPLIWELLEQDLKINSIDFPLKSLELKIQNERVEKTFSDTEERTILSFPEPNSYEKYTVRATNNRGTRIMSWEVKTGGIYENSLGIPYLDISYQDNNSVSIKVDGEYIKKNVYFFLTKSGSRDSDFEFVSQETHTLPGFYDPQTGEYYPPQTAISRTIDHMYFTVASPGWYFLGCSQNSNSAEYIHPIPIEVKNFNETYVKPDESENYVMVVKPLDKQKMRANRDSDLLNFNKNLISISYYDQLGRLSQNVEVARSPNRKDITTPISYDNLGRNRKKYLPYQVSSVERGKFRKGAINTAYNSSCEHYAFYNSSSNTIVNDPKPFSETKFEGSPLNRVMEQGAPGQTWQPKSGSIDFSGHTIKTEYDTNHGTEVLYFFINDNNLSLEGHYSANQLYKTITKDENWKLTDGKLHTIEEFKDKQGQVILKRSYVGSVSSPIPADTYYVYDDFNLLRYVFPPKAVKELNSQGSSLSNVVLISESTSIYQVGNANTYLLDNSASLTLKNGFNFKATSTNSLTIKPGALYSQLCYSYKYDSYNRLIGKKLPGAVPVYMVYDKRDRLVATQDGNQRAVGKWLISKYDSFNRPVMTALYTSPKDQGELQAAVNDAYDATPTHILYESAGTTLGTLYDNQSFPTIASASDILTVNYYDKYPTAVCTVNTYSNLGVEDYKHASLLPEPKGQLTATWVKVLNGDAGKSTGLWTVNFYDNKYRVVQTYSENYLNGYDVVTNEFDFVGKVNRSKHEHAVGNTTIYEEKSMTYDHAGRLLKVEQEYTGDITKAKTILAEMAYDELGQLQTKKLTGAGRNLDYQYNIRGWLIGMNAHKQGTTGGKSTDEFGFALNYNTGASTFGATNQYNGNIGAMEWWSNGISDITAHRQAYGYSYDALNRITNADFKTYSSGWKDVSGYDVTGINYDLNGNIQNLNRYEKGNQIDQLSYGYTGNQLSYVNDAKDDAIGFKELSSTSLEYTYDANGNMTRDDNKKISDIDYNLLNLPEFVEKKDANNNVRNLAYAYSATGVKLENRLPGSKKLQYCSNFVYENGSLKYILNEEGKLNVGDGSNSYQFFVKDHLGNTRLSVKEDGTVEELNHYYPFGMRMGMANSKSDPDQKYLYNGKEMQDETDWLDYGARMYDPSLGRWHVPDPLQQYSSAYVYGGNNPINTIDPSGMWAYNTTYSRGSDEFNTILAGIFGSNASSSETSGEGDGEDSNTEESNYDNSIEPQIPPNGGYNGSMESMMYQMAVGRQADSEKEIMKPAGLRRYVMNHLGEASTIITVSGYVCMVIPGGQGVGAVLLVIGKGAGLASDAATIVEAVKNDQYNYAVATAGKAAVTMLVGRGLEIGKTVGRINGADKLVLNSFNDGMGFIIQTGLDINLKAE